MVRMMNRDAGSAVEATSVVATVPVNNEMFGIETEMVEDVKAAGIPVGVRLVIADDPGARTAAFGSVTFKIPSLGDLVLENMKVLRDQKSGALKAMTPFRVVPDKKNGGAWMKCTGCGELVADGSKATTYDSPFHGDAANAAADIVLSACNACLGCTKRRVLPDKLVELKKLQERADVLETVPDAEKTEEQAIEYAEIMLALTRVYRMCTSRPAFTWNGSLAVCSNREADIDEEDLKEAEVVFTGVLDEAIAGFAMGGE
jgi:hypothetical protein